MKNIDYKIIVDTREKKNDHILEVFDKNNIKYEKRALKVGDYAIEHKGQLLDIVVERKANIDELLQNLIERADNIEKHLWSGSSQIQILTFYEKQDSKE